MWNPKADNAGREPVEGDYVAYNYSGQIATGFITRVTRSAFYIECVLPVNRTGKQSIVRGGPKCMLVLEDIYE